MLTALIAGEPTTVDVLEETTPRYSFKVCDDTGAGLPAGSISAMFLSLYVINADGTLTYLNSRTHQSVLNANNVTVDLNGLGVWNIQLADLTIVDDSQPFERHIALWEWEWGAPIKYGKHELVLTVKNLVIVPTP